MSIVDWNNVRPDAQNMDIEQDKTLEGCKRRGWAVPEFKQPDSMFSIFGFDVKYQLVDPTMPDLKFATEGSVGLDLYNRLDERIPPFAMGYKIPLNVKFKLPTYLWFMLAARSSFAMKHGLLISNGVGIIDRDYTSECALLVYNPTSDIKIIPRGTRIAQAVFMPTIKFPLVKVDKIDDNPVHTGFGSTGQ